MTKRACAAAATDSDTSHVSTPASQPPKKRAKSNNSVPIPIHGSESETEDEPGPENQLALEEPKVVELTHDDLRGQYAFHFVEIDVLTREQTLP
jgi:hypothetical protein